MFLRHVAEDGPWRYGLVEGGEGRAAGRAGAEDLERAALAGRAGAGNLTMPTLDLPNADRRIEPYDDGRAAGVRRGRGRPFTAVAYCGGACRGRSAGGQRSLADAGDRLGGDAPLPPPALGPGLGVAEAMDTAQRGMGLGWPEAKELIGRALEARGGGRTR